MNLSARAFLLAATALTLATPAMAQEADETRDASGNDIIVTAQRVEQRLQDVPISVTVFNQETLDRNNIFSAKDIATYTPGLTTQNRYGGDNVNFTIRGFVQEQRTLATVGTYFADVVMPRGSGHTQGGDGAGPGSLFDLQNVQVLKGPQGTLFGRNSTGGAVLLVPRKPTDKFEGYVEGGLGNYDMQRVQAVVNVPVTDNVKLRFGLDHTERDGYLKNAGRLGTGPYDDRMGSTDYWAYRASMLVDITPDIENYTVGSYLNSKASPAVAKVVKCYPGLAVGGIPMGDLACAQIQREAPQGFWTVSNLIPDAMSKIDQWQVINTTTWAVNESLTVKNIFSYGEYRGTINYDLFGAYGVVGVPAGTETSAGNVVGFAYTHADARTDHTNAQSSLVEELQLQGRFLDGRLNWQGGLYLEVNDPLGFSGVQTAQFTPCADITVFNCKPFTAGQSLGTVNFQVAKTRFTDKAIYTQASFDVSDQITLTGGIRYTVDKMSSELHSETIGGLGTTSLTTRCTNGTAPGFGTIYPIDQRYDVCRQDLSTTSKKPTWLLGIDFKPIQDVLLYAKYTRGYRQGGVTIFGADPLQIYQPETVDTYEIGAKTSWRGSVPGSFNISGFYNDFRNQQLQYGVSCVSSLPNYKGACGATTVIINAGSSWLKGLEAELSLNPVEGLRLNAAYAYLDTKITKLQLPPLPSNSPYNQFTPPVLGEPIANTVPHKATISANYTLPIPESIGVLTVGGTWVYQSKYRSAVDSVPGSGNGMLPGQKYLNLNASFENIGGNPIDISFFMTNVTNAKLYLFASDNQVRGFVSRLVGEPRMWGFKMKYRFGN